MAVAAPEFAVPIQITPRERSFWQRVSRHRLAWAGAGIIVLLLFIALLAPWVAPHAPGESLPKGLDEVGTPHGPGGGFLLGADTLGRDVLARALYGTRISLLVATCAMLTAVAIGTTVGLLAGYFGGWIDTVLTRITEMVMSLPTILLAIALFTLLPGDSWGQRLFKLLLAIALVTWTGIARAVRGQTLSLKEREFVEAARALGCSHGRILTRHLLPNVLPNVIVLATLATAHNILLEAGLSYLGLGIDPSIPTWGGMIAEGQPYFMAAPWISIVPGVAVVIAVTGFNLLGQALQEVLEG